MMLTIMKAVAGFGLIIAIYVGVSWGLSVGGWRRLSREYRERERPLGTRFRSATARIGRTFMQGTGVIVADSGLYLFVALPMVLMFHPPLLIPWHAITREGEVPSWRNQETLQLSVATVGGSVKISLWRDAAKAINAYLESGGQLVTRGVTNSEPGIRSGE